MWRASSCRWRSRPASALGLRALAIEPFRIPTESMLPTLRPGDRLFVNKLVYGARVPFTGAAAAGLARAAPRRRGGVPQGADGERAEVFATPWLVKRIVGLPGDHVRAKDGALWINGVRIDAVAHRRGVARRRRHAARRRAREPRRPRARAGRRPGARGRALRGRGAGRPVLRARRQPRPLERQPQLRPRGLRRPRRPGGLPLLVERRGARPASNRRLAGLAHWERVGDESSERAERAQRIPARPAHADRRHRSGARDPHPAGAALLRAVGLDAADAAGGRPRVREQVPVRRRHDGQRRALPARARAEARRGGGVPVRARAERHDLPGRPAPRPAARRLREAADRAAGRSRGGARRPRRDQRRDGAGAAAARQDLHRRHGPDLRSLPREARRLQPLRARRPGLAERRHARDHDQARPLLLHGRQPRQLLRRPPRRHGARRRARRPRAPALLVVGLERHLALAAEPAHLVGQPHGARCAGAAWARSTPASGRGTSRRSAPQDDERRARARAPERQRRGRREAAAARRRSGASCRSRRAPRPPCGGARDARRDPRAARPAPVRGGRPVLDPRPRAPRTSTPIGCSRSRSASSARCSW